MRILASLFMLAALAAIPLEARAQEEPPLFAPQVASGAMAPMAARLPQTPMLADFDGEARIAGQYGGRLRSFIPKAKDVRLMVVWGYARLMGYDSNYALRPDILRDVEVEEGRIFTFHLRKGHKWSDGAPFTTEDLRYYWEDVANNIELSPSGPPVFMLEGGAAPEVTIIDETTIRYEWPSQNPQFLSRLASARPPFIYRPAHYLKRFHINYGEADFIAAQVKETETRNWAQLHNRKDNPYKSDNPDLPSLQPWINTVAPPAQRFVLKRNPYFHRVDPEGRQLPYIDEVELVVASAGLLPAKANAGEADLLSRRLGFSEVATLKAGEENGYKTFLWPTGAASHIALYPNLNYNDAAFRDLMQNADFRRALSLGIDRRIINRTLFFGLATEAGIGALPSSPLYDAARARKWAEFDPERANALLDGLGLDQRRGDGIRLLPDGRPLRIIIETAGESGETTDALQLVTETWREIGIQLLVRPTDRDIMRNRVYSGAAMMSAWTGWNNGVPTPRDDPSELAPTRQDTLIWPKWGQYYQTSGEAGKPVDLPEAERLLALRYAWMEARENERRAEIWKEMLDIHAEQQFIIGLLYEAPQPIVVSNRLRNVPRRALYAWDPGGQFGVHRMDAFFFADGEGFEAAEARP